MVKMYHFDVLLVAPSVFLVNYFSNIFFQLASYQQNPSIGTTRLKTFQKIAQKIIQVLMHCTHQCTKIFSTNVLDNISAYLPKITNFY